MHRNSAIPLFTCFAGLWLSSVGEVRGAQIYAGGPNANVVDAYPAFAANPAPIAEITSGLFAPTGMTVDRHGNLYVCNEGQTGFARAGKGFWTVTVYRRGATTPFRTYTNGVWSPVDVAVAPDGTAYIANFGNGVVNVYPPKGLDPSRTLVAPSGGASLGVALDDNGNVYVSYVTLSGGGSVYEYAPGQDVGTNLGIAFAGEPHGLAIDHRGNLIVAVSKAPNPGSDLEVYAPGSTQPKQRLTGPFQPFMLALDGRGHRLYAADYGSGNADGGVFVYRYAKGSLLYEDTQGAAAGAYGVAFDTR
jgi:sugar lactone lactonase YvrE